MSTTTSSSSASSHSPRSRSAPTTTHHRRGINPQPPTPQNIHPNRFWEVRWTALPTEAYSEPRLSAANLLDSQGPPSPATSNHQTQVFVGQAAVADQSSRRRPTTLRPSGLSLSSLNDESEDDFHEQLHSTTFVAVASPEGCELPFRRRSSPHLMDSQTTLDSASSFDLVRSEDIDEGREATRKDKTKLHNQSSEHSSFRDGASKASSSTMTRPRRHQRVRSMQNLGSTILVADGSRSEVRSGAATATTRSGAGTAGGIKRMPSDVTFSPFSNISTPSQNHHHFFHNQHLHREHNAASPFPESLMAFSLTPNAMSPDRAGGPCTPLTPLVIPTTATTLHQQPEGVPTRTFEQAVASGNNTKETPHHDDRRHNNGLAASARGSEGPCSPIIVRVGPLAAPPKMLPPSSNRPVSPSKLTRRAASAQPRSPVASLAHNHHHLHHHHQAPWEDALQPENAKDRRSPAASHPLRHVTTPAKSSFFALGDLPRAQRFAAAGSNASSRCFLIHFCGPRSLDRAMDWALRFVRGCTAEILREPRPLGRCELPWEHCARQLRGEAPPSKRRKPTRREADVAAQRAIWVALQQSDAFPQCTACEESGPEEEEEEEELQDHATNGATNCMRTMISCTYCLSCGCAGTCSRANCGSRRHRRRFDGRDQLAASDVDPLLLRHRPGDSEGDDDDDSPLCDSSSSSSTSSNSRSTSSTTSPTRSSESQLFSRSSAVLSPPIAPVMSTDPTEPRQFPWECGDEALAVAAVTTERTVTPSWSTLLRKLATNQLFFS